MKPEHPTSTAKDRTPLVLALGGTALVALGLLGWMRYGTDILVDMAVSGLSWCL